MSKRKKEKNRSAYAKMLGNIASDLDTLLTDLCHVSKEREGREEVPCTTGTLHSADTLGKDSFFSSAGNTSRRQGDAVSSNHSFVSLSDNDRNDCDSVDSGHDGRCRSGPSPLVFDPHHFGSQSQQRSSPMTSRMEVSPSMDELRPISTVERLIKTNSIWLLASMSRAGAVHLLKDRDTGNFIVRKSSQPNSLALSVQSRLSGHSSVDHYLIEGTELGFRLQGSAHFFHSIPALIAYYIENIDEIPYHLRLPTAILQARSTRELTSLDMLGQDFWVSAVSRKSPSPEPMSVPLHKSCSEPINIQRPTMTGNGQITQNTVPSRSASDFSHFMRTQIEMERYFEQHIKDHPGERTDGSNPSVAGAEQKLHHGRRSEETLVVGHTSSLSQACHTPPLGGTTVLKTLQVGSSYTSQHVTESGVVSATSSLQSPHCSSNTQQIHRLASEDSWVMASSPLTPQQQQQLLNSQALADIDPYRSNPSNLPVEVGHIPPTQQHLQMPDSSQSHFTQGAMSLPLENQHLSSEELQRDRALTHPRHGPPKTKSNLYFTTNLGLLEIPENSYFTSNLSDKLSDYEDIWRNSCCESDVDRNHVRMIHDPRAVLDAKVNSHNKNNNSNTKDGKRKVLRKTTKDSPPVRRPVPATRDAVTGGTTGLTALEQARMIAGSTSEDEASLPVAHVKGIRRMEQLFEDQPVSAASNVPNAAAAPTSVSKPETFISEQCVSSIQLPSRTPHQIKFVTSHSLDFSPQHHQESLEMKGASNVSPVKNVSSLAVKEPTSKCVFTTTMSVIMSESASSEQSANAKKIMDKKTKSEKPIPSPLGRLSRLKSSSESSLATVSSPLYAEPADAVKLRDKNGRAINIQVRRRSAPSAPNLKPKPQAAKVSQNPQLDTILSPDAQTQSKNNISNTRFVFDASSAKNQSKPSVTSGNNVSRSMSMRTTSEMSQMQRKQNWKDRLNRLKLGTKVLTRNLTPPSAPSVRKSLANQVAQKDLDSTLFQEDSSVQTSPTTSSPFPGRFPVEHQTELHRDSCFSESSTVQDLISCAHPELSIRPIVPAHAKPVAKHDAAPPSEYDNLGIYRASTHSSQGTVYSPPWETGTANKLIRESPTLPTEVLPPAMDFQERIERWQQANSSYHDTSIIKSSENNNSFQISSSQTHHHSSHSHHELHIQRQQQKQRQLLHHQQQLKMEDGSNVKAGISASRSHDLHRQLSAGSSSQQQQQQQHHHDRSHTEQQHHGSQVLHKDAKTKRLSRQDSGSKVPSTPSSPHAMNVSTTTITNNSITASVGVGSSPHRLSSHCPDVVNCHSASVQATFDIPKVEGETRVGGDDVISGDILNTDGDVKDSIRPAYLHQMSGSHTDWKSPGANIREYIFKLSGDTQTIFGSTIENFIQCTVESQETNPQHVMRNVRQFMTGIKNYLVKHGEGELDNLIERERNKLGTNEILNIDAIIEQALHVCVLKPLKYHIYRLFVEKYSRNGALEQLSRNIKYARTKSAQDIGVKPGLKLPQNTDMEVIKYYLDLMQRSYSPLQKLQNLLKATSTIYHCVQGKHHQFPSRGPSSLGADDFLPMLIYVIVHCGLVAAEIEADFMWGLLQPSLLTGEGGYYLTTLSSAVLILKNFQDTHQLAPAQLEGKLPTISDMQGFLKIAIPDELHDSITWKTLPVRPNMSTRDVCAMVAHKFKITNPQDYGLFLLCDGLESHMADSDCPQIVKGDNLAMGKCCYFAFKRIDANIAWPKHMKHSPVTVTEA